MSRRYRVLADRRSHAACDGLQANAVLVCRRPRLVFRGASRLLRQQRPRAFFNAAASSGVADFGFFGRGVWIDQQIAFSASQPRCGATDVRPSSPVIQSATLRLDHSPPSAGGSRSRSRSLPKAQVSGSFPAHRCGGADRREPQAPQHCNGQAIVRSTARQRLSLPTPVRRCDHAPKARSPGNAAMQWNSDILRIALPTPPRSNACRPPPCVQSPDSQRSSLSPSQGSVNPLNVESISRKQYHPSFGRRFNTNIYVEA